LSKIIDLDGAAAHDQLNGGNPEQRFYLIRIDPQRFPKKDYGLDPLHQVVMPGWQNGGIIAHGYIGENFKELSGRGVFLNSRCMDNLFLNRMNSWQGVVKKEQHPI